MESLLSNLTPWVERHDPHAPHHLGLLSQAEEILSSRRSADLAQRLRLADLFERWRYQYLNEHGGAITEEEGRFLAQIDVAATALAGRPDRPSRSLRRALSNEPAPREAEALACLDSEMPIDGVVEAAREATGLGREQGKRPVQTPPMLMYAPLYLSSHCVNYCAYCGFRFPRSIRRKHLSVDQALGQAELLAARGFRHILLVAGDFPSLTTTAYYCAVLRSLIAMDLVPSIEIAPQSTSAYGEMAAAGAFGVTLYQETYDARLYAAYHPKGSKASYDWRLEGLERSAEAGVQRLGLGVLLGLAEPREDLRALVRHAHYLSQRFPQCTLAFSLPRIHEAPPDFKIPYLVDDEMLIRLYAALRIARPEAPLVLSTREEPALRDRLSGICITQLSAESSTAPGGYGPCEGGPRCDEQFPVCDHRSLEDICAALVAAGRQPVF